MNRGVTITRGGRTMMKSGVRGPSSCVRSHLIVFTLQKLR